MFSPKFFSPNFFGKSYFGVGAVVQVVIPVTDAFVYDKIRDLLTATREFDYVYVGRQVPMLPASLSSYLVLTPNGNVRSVADGSPSMRAAKANYRIEIGVRGNFDHAVYKIEKVLSVLLHPDNRSYGGLCKSWLSELVPNGNPESSGPEYKATLNGSFTYLVNLKTGYSL